MLKMSRGSNVIKLVKMYWFGGGITSCAPFDALFPISIKKILDVSISIKNIYRATMYLCSNSILQHQTICQK